MQRRVTGRFGRRAALSRTSGNSFLTDAGPSTQSTSSAGTGTAAASDHSPADDAGITDAVVCDTFLRFKGLERPAVIVTDLGGVANTKREVRMHIALTRALDLVRIVADEVTMGQDPVLSDLVGI
jgi:hypothetical protein